MQIVLDSLIKLSWPPALEAFANPLQALTSEKAMAYSAIAYILDIGIKNIYKPLTTAYQLSKKKSDVLTAKRPEWQATEALADAEKELKGLLSTKEKELKDASHVNHKSTSPEQTARNRPGSAR